MMHEQKPIEQIWSKHSKSSETLKIVSLKFLVKMDDYAWMNVI